MKLFTLIVHQVKHVSNEIKGFIGHKDIKNKHM